MAGRIREATRDGEELVELALDILRADTEKLRPADIDNEEWKSMAPRERHRLSVALAPSASERLKAAQYLTDRGWGKATEKIELSGPDGGPLETKGEVKLDVPDPKRLAAIASLLGEVGVLVPEAAGGASAAADATADEVHPPPALSPTGGLPPSAE